MGVCSWFPTVVDIFLLAATSSNGCRSCSNCHDYAPPVANCDCNACGIHRAGSASAPMVHGEYMPGGYYLPEGEYVPQEQVLQEQPEPTVEEGVEL